MPNVSRSLLVEQLLGMSLGDYFAECRAYGMSWTMIARLLSEDSGVPVHGTTVYRWGRQLGLR